MYTKLNDRQIILIGIVFVTIIRLSLSIHPHHGNGNGNGFRHILSEVSQNKRSDIELVDNLIHVVDVDTLNINGITIRLSLVDTAERGHAGFNEAIKFITTLCLGIKGELDAVEFD